VGKAAIDKGFTLKDIGVVLHAKFHQDFGKILDKVRSPCYTEKDVDEFTKTAGPSTRRVTSVWRK
jgi:acetyl-CoA synthase